MVTPAYSRKFDSTAITQFSCPACSAPVFTPADSSGEDLTCNECHSELVTAQVDGAVTAQLRGQS